MAIWLLCGILGTRIYKKAVPEFYDQFNFFQMIFITFLLYPILGPVTLILSLGHLYLSKK
jgi:hypothetical protein